MAETPSPYATREPVAWSSIVFVLPLWLYMLRNGPYGEVVRIFWTNLRLAAFALTAADSPFVLRARRKQPKLGQDK